MKFKIPFLTDMFNRIKQERDASQAFHKNVLHLKIAVEGRDAEKVKTLLPLVGPQLPLAQYDKLLKRAIEKDHLGIFQTLLGDKGPNYIVTVSRPTLREKGVVVTKCPLVSIAIESRSLHIATYLASHAEIDPRITGTNQQKSSPRRGHYERSSSFTLVEPVALARIMGLTDIESLLRDRLTQLNPPKTGTGWKRNI
jgi:hypothetical protein